MNWSDTLVDVPLEIEGGAEALSPLAGEAAAWPAAAAGLLDLFEQVGDLVLVLDPAGAVVFANRALREVLGYTPAEMKARTVYEVTRVEDHAACQAWLGSAVGCTTPPRLRLAFVSRAGKLVPAEGSASVRVAGGQVVLLQWVFRDLRNWQREEASQREREEIFHLLTLHAPVGVCRTDAAGRLTYANELWRRLAGFWHHPQPRGVWWQMVHPEERPSVVARWEAAQRLGREFAAEFRVQADGEAARWVRLRLVPAQLSSEVERCWIGITEDMTAQQEARAAAQRAQEELEARVQLRTAELAASNDELSQFAYVVTHDLKAPLRGVQQLTEWLSRDHGQELSEEGGRLVGLLNERVQHLQRLIDGLLNCARVGRTPEAESTVLTFDLVQRIVRLLAPPESVVVEVADHLPVITGNRERLQQVFQNLLDNAIKYLDKPQGKVTVDARRLNEAWHFSVADNGPGIPARYQDKIFQIGQRLHGCDGPNGTGLGLALVKRIVEHRGGRIWVESAEGQGSTLSFTWPDRARAK